MRTKIWVPAFLAFVSLFAVLVSACGENRVAEEVAPAPQVVETDSIGRTPFQATVTTLDGRSWEIWYNASPFPSRVMISAVGFSLPGEPTPTPPPPPLSLAQQIAERGFAKLVIKEDPNGRAGFVMVLNIGSRSILYSEWQSLGRTEGVLHYLLREKPSGGMYNLYDEMKNILDQILASNGNSKEVQR